MPEPKTVHIGTQPGAGTLEASLGRLRVPSSEQNPGARVLLPFPWAPGYLGPTKVGLNPAGVHHGWLYSARCPLLLLQLPHLTLESSLYASDVISLPFFNLQTLPKSLPVLQAFLQSFFPVTQPLPLGLPPAQVAGPHVDWNLGKKGLV